MRLIDADKLIKDIKQLWDYKTVDYITATTVLKQTITDIENQPTVKAIPVKWIENYIKRYYGTGDLVYPEGFLKELVTWWRYDENEYKENTSQTD